MNARISRALFFLLLLTVSICRVSVGEESANALEQQSDRHRRLAEDTARAPEQRPQHTFISTHPSLFTPEEVLAGRVFEKPEFLPPEAYEADPLESDSQLFQPHHNFKNAVQYAQYPIDDSVASDSTIRPEPLIDTASPHSQSLVSPIASEGWIGWKKPSLTTTVLPHSSDGLGITTLDGRISLFPKSFPLLQFTPRFSSHFLSGPESTDLPGQLYDFALDTSLFLPINDRWSFLGGIAPNMFTDFENTSSDALRITGRALFFYKRSDQLKLAAGIIYLNRDDISVIPAAGLIYTPNERLKFDLMFPKPKISYRIQTDGIRERWGYVGGEFGGGTWAIQRSSGLDDVITYRDYKLLIGVEQLQADKFSWFAEGGYVFGRNLEYTSNLGDTELTSTGVIRTGVSF